MKRILVIEDDPAIVHALEAALLQEHYHVQTAVDGEQGYHQAKRGSIDLIILDLILPAKSGEDICRDLRKDGINTPILVLTSKKDELDEVLLLELGADDYLQKTFFSVRKLLARVKTLLRRKAEITKDIDEYTFGNIYVDFKKQEVRNGDKLLTLTVKEFEILKYFILHESEVVTRTMLLDEVWGYENFPTTRTVDNYILSLRKKIEDSPAKPKYLLTVPTAGYKFVK